MATIEEFLVSIGYSVRENEVASWETTLKKVDGWVAKLGVALDQFERKAKALFASATDDLERLNFAAQRAGTSVDELRALTYAMQQVGLGGRRAEDVIGSFAERLRRFPAMASLLSGLGVQATRNGQARDQTVVFRETIQALNKLSYPLAARFAEALGISEDDYNVLRKNVDNIDRLAQEQKDIFARFGIDANQAGQNSALLGIAWREALMTLDAMLAKIAVSIGPSITPLLGEIGAWLQRHQDGIVSACEAVVAAGAKLVEWLGALARILFGSDDGLLDFIEWAAGSNGIIRAVEAFVALSVAGAVAGVVGPLGVVIAGIVALVAMLTPSKAQAGEAKPSGQAPGGGAGGSHGASGSWGSSSRGASGSWFGGLFGGGRSRAAGGAGAGGSGGGSGGSGGSRGSGKWEGAVPAPSSENSSALAGARERFKKELEDPEVAARFAAYVEAEVGGQGAKAQQAFVESIFNRAAARGKSLRETLDGPYFPNGTHQKARRYQNDKRVLGKYQDLFRAAIEGSNISGYATGNASEDVMFAGGPQTAAYGGERFGIEGPDSAWARRMMELDKKDRAAPPAWDGSANFNVDPNQFFDAPPLGGSDQRASLSADQETEIVVHGDPDPVRTASEVGAAQSRVNTDFVAQASKVA
ncbi:hypothetical protein V5F49_20550 [Xanthobacter sp. V3C-3]|uniref:hypothetical protein n=1 Tax=Xanthobacter lutulentifluminis TaxID=3119935 RepID=UPI0037278E04